MTTTTLTSTTAAPTAPRARSATRRLVTAELRLLLRDPLTVSFVVVFPVISMLIIGGSFGRAPDDVFPVDPAHWYIASYFAVVIGATGLIMLPVHIATYRERGVLRRLAASGFPRWSFTLTELVLGVAAVLVGGVALLAVAAPVYGLPPVVDPVRVVAAVAAATLAFISIGVLLGTMLPTARAAQAVGLMLYFPSFLLGGGGPPPQVMGEAMSSIAGVLPLTLAIDAIREPWLGIGTPDGSLAVVALIAVVAAGFAARRTSL
ncbi:ABC transporter permease [Nocardioides marinquilinus]|uniref:ABC transporter permease n=1 Tax=Nocardioides marinquilinus TaxID=1210400 RepID=A0ABP9PQS4_9ACTN